MSGQYGVREIRKSLNSIDFTMGGLAPMSLPGVCMFTMNRYTRKWNTSAYEPHMTQGRVTEADIELFLTKLAAEPRPEDPGCCKIGCCACCFGKGIIEGIEEYKVRLNAIIKAENARLGENSGVRWAWHGGNA